MIDVNEPQSPGWWLKRLAHELLERRERYDTLQSYIDNTTEIETPSGMSSSSRAAYQRLRHLSRTNFAELIVEAPRERMRPSGFRTGASGTEATDQEAWRIWQANSLDADSAIVHRTCLTLGEAYVIVGLKDPELDAPTITAEDPREVIVEHDPIRPRKAIAALKMFRDRAAGLEVAYLYLPGRVLRARRVMGMEMKTGVTHFSPVEWNWDEGETELPGDVIPVVRFVNKPNLRGRGLGEFEAHTTVLDRINHQVLQRLEVAAMQAFRQRAIKGVPDTDEQGNPISYDNVFEASPGAIWLLPPDSDLWESGQVDLGPIRAAIADDVQNLAAVTRTPLYYLSPDAANGSAEGASLAREGLVYKVEDRISQLTESWEQVMRLAFLFAGDTERAKVGDTEVLWAPAERFSLAERFDAATKATSAGVPFRTVMQSILQFSPQEVDRMQAERINDVLFGVPQAADPAANAAPAPTLIGDTGLTLDEINDASDALGRLVRAGVEPATAARLVGLPELEFTGAIPTALRPLATDAARLEGG